MDDKDLDSSDEAVETSKPSGRKPVANIKRNHNITPSTGAGDDNSTDEQDQQPLGADKLKRRGRSPESGPQQAGRGKRFDPSAAYQPLFYFGGKNGESIVDTTLTGLGWKRTYEKTADNIKMRWTECKGAINYGNFREGEQLVNHIPNCELLTNKLGLLMSLRDYERVAVTIKNKAPRLRVNDFHPETYVLDEKGELEMFYEAFKPGEIWICKPTGLNQGIGIYLVRDLEQFKQDWSNKMQHEGASRGRPPKRHGRIIQRYIMRPLLVDDRKFDIRCYMMIASTVPFLVLFHNGYLRLSIYKYNTEIQDLTVHLTNQYIQKKDPVYESVKNDTVWSMEKFNEYINGNLAPKKGLGRDWVWNVCVPRIKQIATHVVNCVRSKFAAKVGYFELFGLDFMIDSDMKLWLIEINTNPSLTTNCEVLKQVIPPLVTEGIQATLECFEKARRHQQLLPLQAVKTWDVLYCGPGGAGGMGQGIRYSPPLNRKAENASPERADNNANAPTQVRGRADTTSPPNGPFRRSPNQPPAPAPAPARAAPTGTGTSRVNYQMPASTSRAPMSSRNNPLNAPNAATTAVERQPAAAEASDSSPRPAVEPTSGRDRDRDDYARDPLETQKSLLWPRQATSISAGPAPHPAAAPVARSRSPRLLASTMQRQHAGFVPLPVSTVRVVSASQEQYRLRMVNAPSTTRDLKVKDSMSVVGANASLLPRYATDGSADADYPPRAKQFETPVPPMSARSRYDRRASPDRGS